MRLLKTLGFSGLILAVTMLLPATARAATITFTPDFEFSGTGETFTGTITYTLEDQMDGTVKLTINWTDTGYIGEFLSSAYLNFDPDLDPTDLSLSSSTCVTCTLPGLDTGVNAFQADGDGKFDIELSFATDDGAPTRFNQTDVYTTFFSYSGSGTFSALSFDFSSVQGGGNGTFFAVAKLQGLGESNEGSGWFGDGNGDGGGGGDTQIIPEPASLLLLGCGVLAVGRRARRRAA